VLSLVALNIVGGCGGPSQPADTLAAEREKMVREQIEARGLRSETVLAAMRKVPRHEFVPLASRHLAYADHPLPIGMNQTISQPYIVALMTDLARLNSKSRVLEIGTGSGYQAAILAELSAELYSIEIIPELANRSRECLARLGYRNIQVREGDGYLGWPEEAPFDAIIVTAAPKQVPGPLLAQLALGGRLVIPVGDTYQDLKVYTRSEKGVREESIAPVRFVPMTGRAL
jgi:protein-L-isoaspartate(D-aspartate) O-methyltransferase